MSPSQLIGRRNPQGRNEKAALSPGQEDLITRVPHSFQEKEAKGAAAGSHRRSPRDKPLEDSQKEDELQLTKSAEGEPERAEPEALSDDSKKDAPRRKVQEKEGQKRYKIRAKRKKQESIPYTSGDSG